MLPTAEQILSNLPFAITLWTALTLCWGLYVMAAYSRVVNAVVASGGKKTANEVCHTGFLMIGNTLLVAFLMLEPSLTSIADTMIVINTFFSVYLASSSFAIGKWWRSLI